MRRILVAILSLSAVACSKYYDVSELDAGESRSIVISAERYYEDGQPIYYQVDVGKHSVVQRTYLSSIDPKDVKSLQLKLVSNKDRSLIGVVDEKLPQKIWLLHNFSTGETWPRCESDSFGQCEQRGQTLLRQLQKVHPEVTFVL
jgi:hypothetical protein